MADNLFMSPQFSNPQLGLNILDIIDAITDDQDFPITDMSDYAPARPPSEAASIASSILSHNDPEIEQKRNAYVKITEQPQPKALRFRYICEGRSAGSIPGVRSISENKTYPSIKIMNYKGPAVAVVSCVTVDPPYRPHPHNLVGKEGCSKGVCTVTIDNDTMDYSFSNLGIQCVKKKDVESALKLREEIRVDPFGTGFGHRNQPQSIDLNSVRLCFQVFLSNGKGGRFTFPLKAVVSDPIYDKKATSDLNICKLSDCTSCVSGGKEIILLCDKVTKEDIKVRFFEVKDGLIEWEAFGDFQASDVHKQVAICFKTPKYKDIQVDHSIKAYVQLYRPSDSSTSEPRPFEFLPMDADRVYNVNKRRKIFEDAKEGAAPQYVDRIFNERKVSEEDRVSPGKSRVVCVAARGTPRVMDGVKVEPPDPFITSKPADVMVGLSNGVRPVSVTTAISPQGTAGGLMYHVSPIHPMQGRLQSPIYYPSTSPTDPRQVMDMSLQSPPQQYFAIPSQGISYSPENRPPSIDGSSYNPTPMDIRHGPEMDPNFELLPPAEIPAYHIFAPPKPPVVESNNEPLPDLGIINSSELNIDSVNNLSASLSCSLILNDSQFPLNAQDKKTTDDDKRSLCTPSDLMSQIHNSSNSVMKSEDTVPSSDSVKLLKGQLETLNKLSERR